MKRYENQIPTDMSTGLKTLASMLKDFLARNPNRRPASPIPIEALRLEGAPDPSATRVAWFGHSAFLLEIAGRRLLFDPMFADTPSPIPLFGSKRYSHKVPLRAEDFPPLDAVILSHDHYDHLHAGTIRILKDKAERFLVPSGVAKRLIKWGVDPAKVTEHAWWEEVSLSGLTLRSAPARHFSGRGLFDRNSTLWCSWAIAGGGMNVFYSGDSGYGPHFKEIGERYGPFDLTLMECGQYDARWSPIHMLPEETVQAHLDVRGGLLVPVHWGAFTLAFHDWTDPIERVTRAARERNVRIATPRIGEPVRADGGSFPSAAWWRTADSR